MKQVRSFVLHRQRALMSEMLGFDIAAITTPLAIDIWLDPKPLVYQSPDGCITTPLLWLLLNNETGASAASFFYFGGVLNRELFRFQYWLRGDRNAEMKLRGPQEL